MSKGAAKGTLYLVPTPLDHGCDAQSPLAEVLPAGTIRIAASLSHWISENAKSTRAFLKRIDAEIPLSLPLQAQQIVELPRVVHKKGDHAGAAAGFDARPLLASALAGQPIGLVSEAGMPAIADPGSSVVRAAHDLGLPVVPLVGPMSLMLALAASGLNGQSFAFVGYLPQDEVQRAQRVSQLEARAIKTGETQLFIETPYRNAALLRTMLATLSPATRLFACSAITLPQANTVTRTVAQWRQLKDPLLAWERLPTVFGIGK